jgi:hypothetical protein
MMIEDKDVSDEVAAILRDDGITVLTSSMPVRVKPPDGGRVRLTVRTRDGEQHREGSHLLSAIGRIPNTEALTPRRPAFVSTTAASSRSTSTWKLASPASTQWGTSRAARPSPTLPFRSAHARTTDPVCSRPGSPLARRAMRG